MLQAGPCSCVSNHYCAARGLQTPAPVFIFAVDGKGQAVLHSHRQLHPCFSDLGEMSSTWRRWAGQCCAFHRHRRKTWSQRGIKYTEIKDSLTGKLNLMFSDTSKVPVKTWKQIIYVCLLLPGDSETDIFLVLWTDDLDLVLNFSFAPHKSLFVHTQIKSYNLV